METPHSEAEQHNGQRSALKDAACRTKEFLGEHPLSSTLTSFAIGFGTGLLIAACLRSSRPPESTMTRWGHRMRDAVSGVVPQGFRT
jgi:hypothetical protein